MLRLRILTAAVLLPLALAGLFLLSSPGWALASGLFIGIGAWEWGRLSGLSGVARVAYALALAAIAWGLGVAAGVTAPGGGAGLASVFWVAVVFWLLVALPWLARGWHAVGPAAPLAAGAVVLVPAWLAVVLLQHDPARLLALMATAWVADTGAYFVGRRFGRRKLAPRVSPGKSWEGVAGGVLAVAAYGLLLEWLQPGLVPGGSPATRLLFLQALLGLGIVGDLFESWMKREAGLKDSGSLLPGHGGVLDRIDSLTSTLPAAALMAGLAARGL